MSRPSRAQTNADEKAPGRVYKFGAQMERTREQAIADDAVATKNLGRPYYR